MNAELQSRLEELRRLTLTGGVPVRRKDAVLYEALAKCLSLCEYIQQERLEADLRAALTVPGEGRQGKGGQKVKATSDVYQMVVRFAFGSPKDRSSIVKYAQTIREAAARQIGSQRLAAWLAANGGTRALYLKVRADNGARGSQRTLHLNEAVDFPKSGAFSITLRYDGKGFFDVIRGSHAPL